MNFSDTISQVIRWLRRPRHRPWVLMLTVVIAFLGVFTIEGLSTLSVFSGTKQWLTDRPFFGPLFFPRDPPDWKDRLTALIPIIGLPIAFLLWHWRDRNVQDQIENQRKDVNLKEFQDVQLRAVGVLSGETPSDSKHILQIAALHQLRAFLKGEYGEGFRRPAFETYSALLSRWDALEWEAGDEDGNYLPNEIFKAVRAIVYEDWKWFFWEDYDRRKGWPLSGRSFHHISLPVDADLSGLDLSRVNFYGSHLDNVNFDEAKCWEANFSKCSMRCSSLNMASCEDAKFDDTDLAGSKAQGSDMSCTSLKRTKFHASDFERANFYKADGSDCAFVNTKLAGSEFSGASFMGVDFQNSRLPNTRFVSARIYRGSVVGADISGCDFSYAFLDSFFPSEASSCAGVKINSKTRLPHPSKQGNEALLSSEMREVHLLWQTHGAILIDSDVEPVGEETEIQDNRIRESRALTEALNAATKI